MAFKIIERFFAVITLIKRFAGSAAEFADAAGMP